MSKKQSYNIKDYILHLNNWIPKNILNKTIKELSNQDWKRHTYTSHLTFEQFSKNGNKELDILNNYELTHIKKYYDLIWKAIEKYILIDKISGEELKGWKGFSSIRFNRYNKGQIMSKHIDHIVDLFTGEKRGVPILSILGILNDNYKGGEFIMFDDYEIKFKAGDLIIFPSNFMYPHLVKPIIKGTRYSFVSWCY